MTLYNDDVQRGRAAMIAEGAEPGNSTPGAMTEEES